MFKSLLKNSPLAMPVSNTAQEIFIKVARNSLCFSFDYRISYNQLRNSFSTLMFRAFVEPVID